MIKQSSLFRVKPGLACRMVRLYHGDPVVFAMPVEGVNTGTLDYVDGANVYITVTLLNGERFTIERLENEVYQWQMD